LDEDPEVRRMSPAERRRLLADLLDIRRAGFTSAESETFQGVRDVVVLVGNPQVGPAAALCAPTLKIRGRWPAVSHVRDVLERGAAEITRSLGLTPVR
jgi:hypothetical protein